MAKEDPRLEEERQEFVAALRKERGKRTAIKDQKQETIQRFRMALSAGGQTSMWLFADKAKAEEAHLRLLGWAVEAGVSFNQLGNPALHEAIAAIQEVRLVRD